MITLICFIAIFVPLVTSIHSKLPFTGIESALKSNPEKYRAILLGMYCILPVMNLLDTDYLDQEPDTYEGLRVCS